MASKMSMMMVVAAAACLLATLVLARPLHDDTNYGSYVAMCDESSNAVVFTNWDQQNCTGSATNFTTPLNQCLPELMFFSWIGHCDNRHMWYQNFKSKDCTGSSVVTRTYQTYTCFNCPNKECKNPN
eukprot:m.10645 g.10645  ORF g.10645 m.10645 type:complete len:127 (-) comp5273_c0_seq1:209-589(-)